MLKQFLNFKTLLAVGFLGLASFGLAQGELPLNLDIGSWFADTAALSAVVLSIVAFLKANVLKSVHGWVTIAVSLGLGTVLGVLGHFLGYVDGGITTAASFGLTAGFFASGLRDAVVGMLGKASEK